MSSCAFCRNGKVRRTAEEMRFRQWSDKGYIYCHVVVTVGVCRGCGSRTLDEDAEKIIDAAFQREYRKVTASAAAVLGRP
jgi:hypothetical protein